MMTERARTAGTASIQIPADAAVTRLRTTDAGTAPHSTEFDATLAIERKTARQSQTRTNIDTLAGTDSKGTVLTAEFAALWNLRTALDSAYTGNGGLYAIYECNRRSQEGLPPRHCTLLPAGPLDDITRNCPRLPD